MRIQLLGLFPILLTGLVASADVVNIKCDLNPNSVTAQFTGTATLTVDQNHQVQGTVSVQEPEYIGSSVSVSGEETVFPAGTLAGTEVLSFKLKNSSANGYITFLLNVGAKAITSKLIYHSDTDATSNCEIQ